MVISKEGSLVSNKDSLLVSSLIVMSNVCHVSVPVVLCLRPEVMWSHPRVSTLALPSPHPLELVALHYLVCLVVSQAVFLPQAGLPCLLLWLVSTQLSSSQVQLNTGHEDALLL